MSGILTLVALESYSTGIASRRVDIGRPRSTPQKSHPDWTAHEDVTHPALAPLPAAAASITYSFSSGPLSATALFEKSGSNLVITLTNTSLADATVPTDILTAVYFEITGESHRGR
jgi:hypothetical protein